MSNLNPPILTRLFSSSPLAVPYDGATVIPHVYVPFAVIVVLNGRILDDFEVDTSSGTQLTFTGPYLRTFDNLRAINVAALTTVLTQDSAPIGTISAYAGNAAPPAGYMWFRKARLEKATYPALYAVIGDVFNDGTQSSSQFMLPDAEGRFIRPFDAAGLVDAARAFGSKQEDAFERHNHYLPTGTAIAGVAATIPDATFDITKQANTSAGSGVVATTYPSNNPAMGSATNAGEFGTFGTETRPKNIALNYIIKVVDGFKNPQLFDMADYAASKPSFARINAVNGWTVPQSISSGVLTDATVVNWNAGSLQAARLTLGGNRTFTFTNAIPNTMYVLAVTQDATGSRSLAFSAAFKWPFGGVLPVLPTTPGAVSYFTFMSSEDGTAMRCIGYTLDVR